VGTVVPGHGYTRKGVVVYIGLGTVLAIVLIILLIAFLT